MLCPRDEDGTSNGSCSPRLPPSRDDHPRNVPTAKPWSAANASAVWPLARHAAPRERHIAVFSDIASDDAAFAIFLPDGVYSARTYAARTNSSLFRNRLGGHDAGRRGKQVSFTRLRSMAGAPVLRTLAVNHRDVTATVNGEVTVDWDWPCRDFHLVRSALLEESTSHLLIAYDVCAIVPPLQSGIDAL
jgi:hypothetical protein